MSIKFTPSRESQMVEAVMTEWESKKSERKKFKLSSLKPNFTLCYVIAIALALNYVNKFL